MEKINMNNMMEKINNFDVQNMTTNGGNDAPNQFIVSIGDLKIFKSYNSIICVVDYDSDTIVFGMDWDYSRTTSKYLYDFLESVLFTRLNKKDIEYIISEGQFPTTYTHWIIEYNPNLR